MIKQLNYRKVTTNYGVRGKYLYPYSSFSPWYGHTMLLIFPTHPKQFGCIGPYVVFHITFGSGDGSFSSTENVPDGLQPYVGQLDIDEQCICGIYSPIIQTQANIRSREYIFQAEYNVLKYYPQS